MTTAVESPPWYGPYDQRSDYQKHLFLGVIIGSISLISAVSSFNIYKSLTASQTTNTTSIITCPGPVIAEPLPLPRIINRPIIPQPAAETTPTTIGIPIPVPDAEVEGEVNFPTRDELAIITPRGSETDGINGNAGIVEVSDRDLRDYFPSADEFVAVQEMPTVIKEEKPTYPEVALLTNREATVWVKALVDKEGRVKEARIAKSSGMNVGFDEAALEAAYKNFYKPAIQNGRPVAIWVTYPVEFKLK